VGRAALWSHYPAASVLVAVTLVETRPGEHGGTAFVVFEEHRACGYLPDDRTRISWT
jgi:hypothetical protein